MDDGQWMTEVGQRYNLSAWPEHHVHMKYRAYVPHDPPPDYPFYVTYRLLDEAGPYRASEPIKCVFNVPAPAVEATSPPYRGRLRRTTDARLTFTLHRPITVAGGPPVNMTDEETHTQDYYTGYFDYSISPDGMTLILEQIDGMLPDATWLEVTLTEHVVDAAYPDQPAIPFTQYVRTQATPDGVSPPVLMLPDELRPVPQP
jgi:hypothetical protein